MELLHIVIWGVAVFTLVGIFFGVALAATARSFYVASDPLIDQVRNELPSANCGACGFAGCQGYAESVVENTETQPSLCSPGGKSVATRVAELTHKLATAVLEKVVLLRCSGITAVAKQQAHYEGIQTCSAATLAFGGPKACKNGCLGLGDCTRICPFDAIHIKDQGIAVVDVAKCTGCGLCVSVCPKNILDLYPKNHRIELTCVAKDSSPVVRPTCIVGCTTCRRCIKACPAGAITWSGKTIEIDHEKCMAYGPDCNYACSAICPTGVIHPPSVQPHPEVAKVK